MQYKQHISINHGARIKLKKQILVYSLTNYQLEKDFIVLGVLSDFEGRDFLTNNYAF
jgi:hypothetical protein